MMPTHAWKFGHSNVDVESLSKTGDLPNGFGRRWGQERQHFVLAKCVSSFMLGREKSELEKEKWAKKLGRAQDIAMREKYIQLR